MSVPARLRPVTPQDLAAKKLQGEKIVSVTAYDYSTAKLIDQTQVVDFLLVGDSLGMVVLGYADTLSVTMDDMLHHLKAVRRGTQHAMVVVDMPFMSVHIDFHSAVTNAGRMMQEGQAQAVKIEGASELTLATIRHLTEIGIPVMGHLGFTPQSVQTLGGFKVQARSLQAVEALIQDAEALQAAGAFAIVLEMIPAEVAQLITSRLHIPTIGIGAGPDCDGQILVIDDLIGHYPDFKPRFARPYARVDEVIQSAIRHYAEDTQSRAFPNLENEAFRFPSEWLSDLKALALKLPPVDTLR